MDTQFITSSDGARIAYDCCGNGPAILLVHGGGGNRQEWHEAGYVRSLSDEFTAITLDLRGHGESDLPTDAAAYTTDKMGQDILSVADVCGFENFIMWGMSFGGKISRYLAVQSERVVKFIMMGTPLGMGVSGERRQEALDFCAHWEPIQLAQVEGTLDLKSLSQNDHEFLEYFHIPSMLGWVRAMLDWPSVGPADFRCPTLWLVGSEDPYALASMQEFETSMENPLFQLHMLDGFDHQQVFDEVEVVLPIMLEFTKSP
jgi:pimeloyl-ACP methyl ester carboxylesterase